MATIQQLWDNNGRKPGLRVHRPTFNPTTYLEVLDIRNKTVVGWIFREGHKASVCSNYSPQYNASGGHFYDDWEVFVAPVPTRKVKLFAGIVISASSYGNHKVNPRSPVQYERTVALFETADQCRTQYGDRFIKLQELPVTTIEVPL